MTPHQTISELARRYRRLMRASTPPHIRAVAAEARSELIAACVMGLMRAADAGEPWALEFLRRHGVPRGRKSHG